MRIVIDLQSCQSGSRLGGIGRYSTELAKAMIRNGSEHDFWIILNNLSLESEPEIRHAFSDLVPQNQIIIFEVPYGIAEAGNNITKVIASECIREDFIKSINPDIVHITSLFEGLHEEIITSVGQVYPAFRTAVTLYDLIPLVQEERYLVNHDAKKHYMRKVDYLKKAGMLLSISEFSRDEAINILGLDTNSIVNISSAADERFKPMQVTSLKANELRQKYGIRKKFMMYTGSFDQRKNHANLIRAIGLIPKNIRQDYQLLVVGNGWDGIYQQLNGVAQEAGLEENDIIFAGHIADGDLLPLYNLCDLFVFPSLAEGFGLPVLEAMSCGIPTICSNCTSLPEVIGRVDAQFDPKNPESIAETIIKVLTNEKFAQSLREHGLSQAKQFSWDISAKIALTAFEKQYKRLKSLDEKNDFKNNVEKVSSIFDKIADLEGINDFPVEFLHEAADCIALNRYHGDVITSIGAGESSNLHVGWVTTWNTRCGIAEYTNFIMQNFPSKQTFFAPYATWTIKPDEHNVQRCWRAGGQDDLSSLYRSIMQSNIQVLMIQFNYGFFDFTSLATFLRDIIACKIRVFITFHSTNDPSYDKQLSSIKSELSECDGLFVHTFKDVNVLRELGLGKTTFFLPQGVIEKQPDTIDLPVKNVTVIATYGFALPHKGLMEVVEAFAQLSHEQEGKYHLLMVNAEYPAQPSTDLVASIKLRLLELGLMDCVTLITDYLPDEVSLGYLKNADIIIYAYQQTGESSSAAVRMGIASGKPIAVTPLHIFDDVSSVVFKLPGTEVGDIVKGIKEILESIENKEEFTQNIANNSVLWQNAHRYSTISKYLYWIMTKPNRKQYNYFLPPSYRMTPMSKSLVFKATAPEMKTQVGRVTEKGIKTSAMPGILLFGPFISIAPGKYRVVVVGESKMGQLGISKVDIAIESGTNVLVEKNVVLIKKNLIETELLFEIEKHKCLDLEVRIFVDHVSDIEIFAIEVMPLDE